MKRLLVAIFFVATQFLRSQGFIYPDELPTVNARSHPINGERQYNLLPDDCGNVRPTWRVDLYARSSELYEFPFYTELIYETTTNDKDSSSFHCGGTLISKNFVLTAASCIKSKPKIIAVRLGEYDLNTNPDCYPEIKHKKVCAPLYVEINITEKDVTIHNLYNKSTEDGQYDVALIRLPKEVQFNDAVEPVCLPIKSAYQKQGNLTLIGFPKLNDSTPRSNILRSLSIPHVKNPECQILFNKLITSDYLCAAGRSSEKYCQGYGGNAILYVIAEEYRLRWILGAIVPYGMNICDPNNVPKIFPRIQMYNEWILKSMKSYNKK